MQRKMIHGFLAALLVVMQLCTLVGIRHVQAVESPKVEQTLIDSDDLTLKATGVQNGDLIDWTLQYKRKASPAPRALKVEVKADDTALTPINATDWHELQAADTQWWQEKDFTTETTGSLRYQTPITQTSLAIMAQLDEQPVAAATEASPVATEPQLNVDLLDDQVAGPHTVTLTLPEVEQPVPDPEDEAAQAEATEESVVTAELPAAPTAQADASTLNKAANETVIKPSTATFQAQNLVLTLGARADLKMNVLDKTGADRKLGEIVTKTADNRWKYDSEATMRTHTSSDYVEGSTSRAVIFEDNSTIADAKIELSYSHVGYVQDQDGNNLPVGAYVEVQNMTFRSVEWDESTMAIDFSNNFYSGVSIANMRHFDWNVTFFLQDDVHTKIEFSADSEAKLTFTSLNPGEFVAAKTPNLTFSTADPNSVRETNLSPDRLVPDYRGTTSDPNSWESFIRYGWPSGGTLGIKAYTSHKWGNWDETDPDKIVTTKEWQDRLGTPSFGNGAAAFTLIGSTFSFTRGTYSKGQQTWLANASGDAKFTIPKLENNKSISAVGNNAGGSEADIENIGGQPYTANELDGNSVDTQADAGAPMYYYINQQTYKVIEELVSRPQRIVISDLLPEGMVLYSDNVDADILIFNERPVDNKNRYLTPEPIKPVMVGGRQQLTITLPASEVMKIPFGGGFFSIRVRVKTTYDRDEIKEQQTMTNEATVKMYGSLNELAYDKTTDPVTVFVTPKAPDPVDPAFKKVDDFGQAVKDVTFGLFTTADANGDPVQTQTSTSDGTVKFTKIAPGDYWLKETYTPTGYVPLTEAIAITVNEDGSITWPKDWQHNNQVVNDLKRWTIELEKTDDEQKRLAHAEFQLSTANGTVITSGITTTNANLILASDQLIPGTYALEETKAPTGFAKLNGKFTFTLNIDGTISSLKYTGSDLTDKQYRWEVANHKLHLTLENNAEEIPLPVTGGDGIKALITMAVMMMLLALMLGWHWRKEALR